MAYELCRSVAFEAAYRDARVNPDELWAVLETVDDLAPQVVVDVGSPAAVWWAWWSLGVRLVGVTDAPVPPGDAFTGSVLPAQVVELVGDRRDPAVRLRVVDQLAGVPADVLVLDARAGEEEIRADFTSYAPLVRDGGLVLVHGIADPARPGAAKFWAGLHDPGHTRELVGARNPAGYGVVEIHGRDREDHG